MGSCHQLVSMQNAQDITPSSFPQSLQDLVDAKDSKTKSSSHVLVITRFSRLANKIRRNAMTKFIEIRMPFLNIAPAIG
jgi:hypothetical protein